MKKSFIFSLALISAAFVSCTKEFGMNGPAEEQGTRVEILVGNTVIADDDAKTAYTPGTGIAVQGTENISMFYVPEGSSALAAAGILATPAGTPGTYSFTVPAGAERATWYAVMPYSSSLVGKNSSGASLQLRLGPVQFPKANSFDPQADYMVGEGFDLDVTSGAQTAAISSFKRLFAPLRIRVTGLEEGEKIYAFTIASSQAPTRTSALNGLTYVSFGKEFSATKVTAVETTSEGNAMSAVYKDGLAAVDGAWPVWLVVNPVTLNSGSSLTFTVTTESKTYTRTVTLSSDIALKVYSNAINDMSVNIKGEGSASKNSSTAVFMDSKIADGWTFVNHSFYTEADSVLPAGVVRFTNINGSFTFPTIPGKDIIGARIYTHPSNRSHASRVVTLTVDGTDKYNFNLATTAADGQGTPFTGGAVEVGLPAGKTSLAGLQVKVASAEQHIISAITLYLQDGSIDKNDYYALYQAGEDIVIAGLVVNKEKYPVSSLVKAYEFTNANYLTYEKYGVVFLDYDVADGKEDAYQIGSNLKPENMIIIGRYKNHQPRFTFAGSATIGPVKTMLALKNVRFETTNYSVTTGNETCPLNLYLEDCTMITTSEFSFCQANATVENNYESINVVNSVLRCTKSVLAQNSQVSAGSTYTSLKKLSFKNTVFTAPATTAGHGAFQLRTNSSGGYLSPNVDIEIDHCTFHNFNSTGLGILPVVSAKSIVFDYNVIGVALGKGCAFVQVGNAPFDPKISGSVSGNNAYSSTANTWAVEFSSKLLTNSGLTVAGNVCKVNDDPFAAGIDSDNLYIPVNTDKVTNGAGASYSTKLWKTWTE